MKIKFGFIFLVILVTTDCFSQETVIENDSLLMWQKNRLLKWDDFRGPSKPVRFHNAAGTGMTIRYQSEVNIYGEVEVIPICYFEKYRSWTKTDDFETLEHEQLHFDIQELYTRKLRKIFNKYKEEGENEKNVYTETADSIFNVCQSVQNKYDSEVLVNYPKFLEWKAKIASELKELKEYEFILEE